MRTSCGAKGPEKLTLRIVGSCFLMLSAYIAYDSLDSLLRRKVPARSLPGVAIAVASLIAMPLLSRAKRRVGVALGSAAMAADARQTDFCTYLSAIGDRRHRDHEGDPTRAAGMILW
jgi:divalent metal cation (Fe/Co/Zn/Cd) transporter